MWGILIIVMAMGHGIEYTGLKWQEIKFVLYIIELREHGTIFSSSGAGGPSHYNERLKTS